MRLFDTTSRSLFALSILAIALPTNALHFYMGPSTPKCFTEELIKDTVIAADFSTSIYNRPTDSYNPASSPVEIQITIDELFDNDHRVLNIKRDPTGKFTFTAQDSGDHRMCFTALHAPAAGGWLSSGTTAGSVKFKLDLAIGDTSEFDGSNRGQIDDVVQRVKDLNQRLESIRREQIHQREREAEFRTVSEAANSRVVRWTLVQLVVLSVTCAWQLSHLRNFFIKQKLT